MIRSCLLIALAGVLTACSPAQDKAPAPESAAEVSPVPSPPNPAVAALKARIAAQGAGPVLQDLTGPANPEGLTPMLAGVATGDPQWLDLVPAIQPESDGWIAEGLQDALGQALSRNTAGVLALMPKYGSYFAVCAERPEVRSQVAAITDPALQAAKGECLSYMDRTAPEVREMDAAQ